MNTLPASFTLSSPAGLRVEANGNGSLRRFDAADVSLALFPGNEFEAGPANVHLRRLDGTPVSTPLIGPQSPTRFTADPARAALLGSGRWQGIAYRIALVLARDAPAWFWQVELHNETATPLRVDLTYAQDLALASYFAVRLNEYYVSQYLDHTALRHPERGFAIATRQNQAVEGRFPWSLIGSLREGVGYATDALQFHGLAARAGAPLPGLAADLPSCRRQHEHALAVIRDAALCIEPGARQSAGFFGLYLPDHPTATTAEDAQRIADVLRLPEAALPRTPVWTACRWPGPPSPGEQPPSPFDPAAALAAHELQEHELAALFPGPWRQVERDDQGRILSFFHGDGCHVVLRAKELAVLRPHGHILRGGAGVTPDESALTSTVWMAGTFHSMLTQGHVGINRFLSTVHGYLGWFRSQGLRLFVEVDSGWRLLDVPSAFSMTPDACRWFYRHASGLIEVRSAAAASPCELTLAVSVREGPPARLRLSHHIAFGGDDGAVRGGVHWRRDGATVVIAPPPDSEIWRRFPQGDFTLTPSSVTRVTAVGGDELLWPDGRSRGEPHLCLELAPAREAALTIRGRLIAPPGTPAPGSAEGAAVPALATGADPAAAFAPVADILPWFTHDAWVHFLAPRGLEQYSGGGWGTRDVCQGPVEMLLATGRLAALRDLVLTVMRAQNPDGDWPQWFTFFERDRGIRAADAHGDVVFWPLLALAQYLIASGDAGLLEVSVPFFDPRGPDAGEPATVWQHVERAFALIERRSVAGSALPAYGNGDWNDSLQPVDPRMRDHLASAWTATLAAQTCTTLARALRRAARHAEADAFAARAARIARDFRAVFIADGVLAGYASFEDGGRLDWLLHPRDGRTGIRFSALAMIHAILEDLLTPEEARAHLALIATHLSGPDGVRLFDRPMAYHGGPQRVFQRAESASFFGREIGLMYTHAHLRHAQALAHVGDAEGFWRGLCLANPVGIRALVPSATLRQANCYFSSSDAAFADRAQASAEYARVNAGTIPLEGGWRVYSSGPGIAVGLVVRRLLGLDLEAGSLHLDPVMPARLDGLKVATGLLGRLLQVTYRVGAGGCGLNRVTFNGVALPVTPDTHAHRRGGGRVELSSLDAGWREGVNELCVEVG